MEKNISIVSIYADCRGRFTFTGGRLFSCPFFKKKEVLNELHITARYTKDTEERKAAESLMAVEDSYALGDSHNYMDKDDCLREMYLDTVGHDEQSMKRYERMVNIVGSRYMRGPKTEEQAIDEAMLNFMIPFLPQTACLGNGERQGMKRGNPLQLE